METILLGEGDDFEVGIGLLHDVQISGPLDIPNSHLHMLFEERHNGIDSRSTSREDHDVLWCNLGAVLGVVVLYDGLS